MVTFWTDTRDVVEHIRDRIGTILLGVDDPKMRMILHQRTKSASFLKGVMGYYFQKSLCNRIDEEAINVSSNLEIFCSSAAILDNAVDRHEERNGQTTYLKELGLNMQIMASHYAFYLGLRGLLPYLGNLCSNFPNCFTMDEAVIGMIRTDLEQSEDLPSHLKTIDMMNGTFNKVSLKMIGATATTEETKVNSIGEYGRNVGIVLGIYEELRDLVGEHGRRRGTEIEEGRLIVPIHIAKQKGFYLPKNIGKKLEEREYIALIKGLNSVGAIDETEQLILEYLNKSTVHLEESIEGIGLEKAKLLNDTIKESAKNLVLKSKRL